MSLVCAVTANTKKRNSLSDQITLSLREQPVVVSLYVRLFILQRKQESLWPAIRASIWLFGKSCSLPNQVCCWYAVSVLAEGVERQKFVLFNNIKQPDFKDFCFFLFHFFFHLKWQQQTLLRCCLKNKTTISPDHQQEIISFSLAAPDYCASTFRSGYRLRHLRGCIALQKSFVSAKYWKIRLQ